MSSSQSEQTPPMSTPRPSGRKGSKKVRTGCITCKIRKVKCDETKPACLRCTRTGRRCDGYVSPSPSPPPSRALSHSPQLQSSPERHAFEFYRVCSAPLLGGALDSDFWAGLVIPMSLREPVVRHAVLAIASLHEDMHSSQPGDRTFAYTEYGKAMAALRKWDARSSPASVLLVCVLFICIEYMLEQVKAAQLHITQGRQVLFMLSAADAPDMALVRKHLVPVYTRLSLISFFYANQPAPIPDHLRATTSVPVKFESLGQARDSLYHMMDEALRFTTKGFPAIFNPNTPSAELAMLGFEQQRQLNHLSQWNVAFTMLNVTAQSNNRPSQEYVRHLLQLYYYAGTIWVSTALQPFELKYDAHMPSFAAIVSHAAAIVNTPELASFYRLFNFETDLLPPVYWTAAKCRHPLLRRMALKLLVMPELAEKREGLWYGRECVAVASRVIELEEQSLREARQAGSQWMQPGNDYAQMMDNMVTRHYNKSLEVWEGELQIPTTEPPTLGLSPSDDVDWPTGIGLNNVAPNENFKSFLRRFPRAPRVTPPVPIDVAPPLEAGEEALPLESPFGVEERDRVKNAMFGTRTNGGMWTTLFRDSRDGTGQWDVKRELLKI